MPGFPFGPIRPKTRAGLPLTSRVLVPAVRRSLAASVSGAAVARVAGRKGIPPAIATPDARICRRVSSVGLSFSLIAGCSFHAETSPQFSLMLVRDCCVSRALGFPMDAPVAAEVVHHEGTLPGRRHPAKTIGIWLAFDRYQPACRRLRSGYLSARPITS